MNPVLQVLMNRYRSGRAGRTGEARRDLIVPFIDLMREAGTLQGTPRHDALGALEALEKAGIIVLHKHPRGGSDILKVRLPLEKADAFFAYLGQSSPEAEREALAELFLSAVDLPVPASFGDGWKSFCRTTAQLARSGGSIVPFDRKNPEQAGLILKVLPQLLAWPGESLLRFASAVLFGDSKTLEMLRGKIETCLSRISAGGIQTLADLGITENERSFLLHGPLRLALPGGELDLGLLEKPSRISASDLRRATLATAATRCLTVENAAMLYELAKFRTGLLLASSGSEGGFANSAVLGFLRALPSSVELWHFGDSDPKGFEILAHLREATGRQVNSLHMKYRPKDGAPSLTADDLKTITRLLTSPHLTETEKAALSAMQTAGTKGAFEQEALGQPKSDWPFYTNGQADFLR